MEGLNPTPAGSDHQQMDLSRLRKVVPNGFQIVEADAVPVIGMGDLNGDGRDDAALLLQDMRAEQPSSAVAVAYAQADGSFRFGEMTGNFGPEPLQYTDAEMLSITDKILLVAYQSMRWGVDLNFRFEPVYGNLRLIGSASWNDGNEQGDGSGTTTTDYLKGTRVGNFKRWDAAKGKLIDLPETQAEVSRQLKAFATFNDDSVYVEQ